MKTAFIGHRQVFAKNIDYRLTEAIKYMINKGCRKFTMGTHGEFDRFALDTCIKLRKIYNDLDIEVAISSLSDIKKVGTFSSSAEVKTVMYETDSIHYKRRITECNRKMIGTCDTLICYVDTLVYKSGAKEALRYAQKCGLEIINLYYE